LAGQVVSWVPASAACRWHSCAGTAGVAAVALRLTAAGRWVSGVPAAYAAGPEKVAYVENVAVGDRLPEMPIFLTPDRQWRIVFRTVASSAGLPVSG
jgi:hypothetical protein